MEDIKLVKCGGAYARARMTPCGRTEEEAVLLVPVDLTNFKAQSVVWF